MALCSEAGCGSKAKTKGMCENCYKRAWRVSHGLRVEAEGSLLQYQRAENAYKLASSTKARIFWRREMERMGGMLGTVKT